MKKIAIIGSINMDIVSSVMQFPEPGETVKGLEFRTCPGGKGQIRRWLPKGWRGRRHVR